MTMEQAYRLFFGNVECIAAGLPEKIANAMASSPFQRAIRVGDTWTVIRGDVTDLDECENRIGSMIASAQATGAV